MRTSNAGTSPAVTQEVLLSIEPVHIYTDPNLPSPPTTGGINTALGSSSISSVLNAFDRERKLQDILPDGTNVFADRKPASVQLSEDVRRLWAERGDFSRFRTGDLLKKRARDEDAAAVSGESSDDDDEEETGKKEKDDKEGEEGLLRPAGERVGGTIAESQFIELRNKVLSNLDVAHFNSIHAHQLLGMLIKQHRSAIQSSSSTNVAARMGSPAPSVGGQSARSGSTTTAAATSNIPPKAPLGIFSHLNQPSSNREEEFILDPLSISLSRTSLNASTATRRTLGEKGGDEEDDEDDEYDHDPTSASFGLKQAKREMESTDGFKENKLREFKVVLETKRKAIGNAAELLSSAAEELRGSHAANRERWRGLIGLHGRGWGLTPGRPLLDVERFGVSTAEEEEEDVQPDTDKAAQQGEDGKEEVKKKTNAKPKEGTEKKATGLQGFGTPIITSDGKVKEEGARDAWIGFGLPEAPIELRRRSIAYWADLPSSSNASEEEVKQKLVFPDRMHRRLRVRFILWPPTTASGGEGEGRIEWSSDPLTGNVDGGKKEANLVVGQILDNELQAASREASDELVFGDVVAQARLLPPTFGVRLTSSSVRIVLTKRLDLVVELVPTTTTSSASEEYQSQLKYAPHASLLLAFLQLSTLRQYQSFVKATSLGRHSDAAARAAAIKAVALAVPKKSTAAGGGKDSTAGVGGGKGIAAGGKASSAALGKLDSLGPVVVGLHYWSFVHRLGSLLQSLQENAGKSGVRVKVQLVPITPSSASASVSTVKRSKNLTDLIALLGKLVDATPSKPYFSASTQKARLDRDSTAIHTIYQTCSTRQRKETMDALKGFAKVFVEATTGGHQSLVCTLSFGQPSLLSVQFATPKRSADGGAKSGVRLTNKPLAVDLETLGTLLGQRIGQYTS